MSETRVFVTAVSLVDDPAQVSVGYGANGRYAVLRLGPVEVHIAGSTQEVLQKLAEATEELADWHQQVTGEQVAA